jgi:hypothetical protein
MHCVSCCRSNALSHAAAGSQLNATLYMQNLLPGSADEKSPNIMIATTKGITPRANEEPTGSEQCRMRPS